MFSKRLIRSIFVILITVLIFILLFVKINLQEMMRMLVFVNPGLLILAVFVSIFSNIFVVADKWRRILKAMGCAITFKEALLISNGSTPMNFILPLKSGELAAKALYLNRQKKLDFKYTMVLTGLDKASNLFATLIILFIGVFFYNIRSPFVDWPPLFALITFCVSIDSRNRTVFSANILKYIKARARAFCKRTNTALSGMSLKKKIWLLIYSVFLQSTELVTAYILFSAVGITIPLHLIFIYIPIVVLLTNVPITVSGLGIREAAIVFLFFKYGSPELLLIVGILISFTEYILPAVIGLFFLPTFIKKVYVLKPS